MPIFRASLILSSLLAAAPVTVMAQPHIDPPAAPPAGNDGDVLRGPEVPKKGIESDRQFTGGKPGARPQGQMASKPEIEQGAFFTALEAMRFEGDLGASVVAAREEFVARVKAWEKSAGEKRKQLFEKRKQAAPSAPPSEEFKREMNAIEASRPKLFELQQRVYGMLSEAQGATLKDAYDAELKRVRDEIARKTEDERKRKDAERAAKGETANGKKDGGKTPPATPPATPAADPAMTPKA
jgi:hypothetical protein